MTHVDIKRLKRLASSTLATVSVAAFPNSNMNTESRCPNAIKKFISKATSGATPVTDTPVNKTSTAPDQIIPVVNNRAMGPDLGPKHGDSSEKMSDTHRSLAELVQNSAFQSNENTLFQLQHEKLLRINLGQSTSCMAWIKYGTRVASQGSIKFNAQGMRDQCLKNMLKKVLTAEGMKLVKCEGNGVVLCGDEMKLLHVLQLVDSEVLFINGSNLLAMSEELQYSINFISAMNAASGMFCVKLCGKGTVAFGCHGAIYTLQATEESPVYTDPNATVAWTHPPSVQVNVNHKSLIGKGSGEEVQLEFKDGFVIVQPYQHVPTREPITPSLGVL
eukprot:gb/GEZJ01005210.1/.p1 GENE.gb/GEZJ01005210.1/~~gb/GEZJ01005210.1/.p1  ORF type:complete len:332 (-),score=41.04 gb/GEZJ01005210.1/:986-1981(-)